MRECNNDQVIIRNLMDIIHEVSRYLDMKSSQDHKATSIESKIKELSSILKEERKNARQGKSKSITR